MRNQKMSGSSIAWLAGGGTLLSLLYIILSVLKKKKNVNIAGKVVLITGASSGVGEACAHMFYKAGCKVILAARRVDQLERVKKDLLKIHLDSENYAPEVVCMDLEDVNLSTIENITQIHGKVDILINNGGISNRSNVMETSIDVYKKIMNINYFGQVALTKALLPDMIDRESGHIVYVSSVQGKIAIPDRSAYSASKHASQAFFDSLRAEVIHNGVHVTVVNPAYINTNLSLNAVVGDGSKYGVMDSTTSSGMSGEYVAQKILAAVVSQAQEVTLAPLHHKLAIVLRNICPNVFFKLMKSRAKKQRNESSKEK